MGFTAADSAWMQSDSIEVNNSYETTFYSAQKYSEKSYPFMFAFHFLSTHLRRRRRRRQNFLVFSSPRNHFSRASRSAHFYLLFISHDRKGGCCRCGECEVTGCVLGMNKLLWMKRSGIWEWKIQRKNLLKFFKIRIFNNVAWLLSVFRHGAKHRFRYFFYRR